MLNHCRHVRVLVMIRRRWTRILNKTTSTNKGQLQFQFQFCDEYKYLNVNLSHELWKDITFDFLQIQYYDDPPVGVYLWRLLWRRWQVLNWIIFFAVLRPFSKCNNL